MSEEMTPPKRSRLRVISVCSATLAIIAGVLFYNQIRLGAELGWVWWIMLITLSVIVYSICFYFGVIIFENTLERYIVSDTFKKKNKWIDVETETAPSGDDKIDAWVAHYKFTRIMFAMGLLPLLAMIYLFWLS